MIRVFLGVLTILVCSSGFAQDTNEREHIDKTVIFDKLEFLSNKEEHHQENILGTWVLFDWVRYWNTIKYETYTVDSKTLHMQEEVWRDLEYDLYNEDLYDDAYDQDTSKSKETVTQYENWEVECRHHSSQKESKIKSFARITDEDTSQGTIERKKMDHEQRIFSQGPKPIIYIDQNGMVFDAMTKKIAGAYSFETQRSSVRMAISFLGLYGECKVLQSNQARMICKMEYLPNDIKEILGDTTAHNFFFFERHQPDHEQKPDGDGTSRGSVS
ncbi:MAG: hypothetical protein KDK51_02090 [Deltaproteobacteria bacterium]|nr:hypothetical protein [Deltaproteobacteria bacterium]